MTRIDPLTPAAEEARRYRGEPLAASSLFVPDFRTLIDRRGGDDAPYLIYYAGARRRYEASFARYAALCRGLARMLADDCGVLPGTAVIVALGNSPAALVAYGALLALGAVVVPVNPAEAAETVRFIAADCGAAGCLYNELTHFPPAAAGGFALRLEDDALFSAGHDAPWPEALPSEGALPALLIYTSGTTGRSKGVLLDQGNLLVNAEATRRLHGMDRSSVHMTVLPLFHVNAFVFSFVTTLYCAARLVLNRSFYLPAFWGIAAAEGVEVISAVPTVVRQLVEDRRALGREQMPPGLRYLVSAAAALSAELLAAFLARYGVRIVQGYGLSEAVNFSLTVPPSLSELDYREVMFSGARPPAGVAVYGNEVTVVDEAGAEVGEGVEGEVAIRGWNVMRGYVGAPAATAAAFRGGWLHSGDKGWYRELAGARYFFLAGRIKEVVKRRGESINLLDIDEALFGIAGVGGFAAVGFANDAAGEEIGLFVVRGETELDEEAILAACRERLPPQLCPKAVVFGGELPRTPTGKIQRTSLAARFAAFERCRF